MGSSIVDIKNMGDALRNTGYKNIESAVSEIIDNSIEANAKNIFIILKEHINPLSGRKVVNEIGFLDDGEGMETSVLGSCLGIGSTTRQSRRGMGRFGVGLPQASLYACPEVVVYSWQNGIENAKKVFLDINKVKDGIQTEIEDPVDEALPEEYAKYMQYKILEGSDVKSFDFTKSGVLVIWKNCDRISPKTRMPLTDRLEFSLGQKFRYFIHKGISKIYIICDENQDATISVFPNDPLLLMNDNYVLCNAEEPKKIYEKKLDSELEPPFELYTGDGVGDGEIRIPVQYIDRNGNVKSSEVIARFSIVKDKFYDETAIPKGSNPGNFELGKHAARLEGISIIRANREIDFREFDFYSATNEPQHRWWGCEIIFDPELDEAFGVANNKQYVELKKIEKEDVDSEELVQPMWLQLVEYIKPTIKAMYAHNEETRHNTRTFDNTQSATTDIINTVEQEDDANDEEDIENPIDALTPEEVIQTGKEELTNLGFENPTDEQATAFINNSVNFDYADKGERSPAFDYKFVLSTTVITINTSHKFYTSFLSKIYENPEVKTTFELFLASFIQSVRKTDTYQKDENDRLMTMWYNKLNSYIMEQLSPRK